MKEILQIVWELMPDDLTENDACYTTQVEPHIRKAMLEYAKSIVPPEFVGTKGVHTPNEIVGMNRCRNVILARIEKDSNNLT